jgi:hypothetical protein
MRRCSSNLQQTKRWRERLKRNDAATGSSGAHRVPAKRRANIQHPGTRTLVTFQHAVAWRLLETAHLQPPAARDAAAYTPFSMQDNAISQPARKGQMSERTLIAEAWAAPEPLCRAEDIKSSLSCVYKRNGDCPKPQQTDGLASSLGWGGTGEQSRRFAEAEGQWGSTENTLIAERTPDT